MTTSRSYPRADRYFGAILTWRFMLPVGLLVAATPYLLPTKAYGVMLTLNTVCMTLGALWAWLFRPMRTRFPMGAMVVACAALATMNVDWALQGGGAGPFGSVAATFSSVAFLAGGLASVAARRPGVFRDGLLDAIAALLGVAALQWQWSRPASFSNFDEFGDTLLSISAALVLGSLIAVVWRMLFDKRQNQTVIRSIIVANTASFLSAYVTSSWSSATPLWAYAISMVSGWLLLGVFVHPDTPRVFEPEPNYETRLNVLRWLGPASALVIGPAMMLGLVVSGEAPSTVVAFSSVLLTGVVVWRIGRLLSERESGRRELALSEQRFRSLVEHAADVIAIADEQGRITYLTGGVKDLLGTSADELIGKSIREVLAEEPDSGLPIALSQLPEQRGSTIYRYDVKLKRPDDRLRWVSVRITSHFQTRGVGGWVLNVRDNTDRKLAEEALSRMALYDSLTSLPNRTHLRQRLEELTGQYEGAIALLFCDLDGFKEVNDVLGHEMGDEVLRSISDRWSALLRPDDVLGRWGGDEFLVICPDISSIAGGTEVAERLLRALENRLLLSKGSAKLGCSIGVALHQHGETVDELISRADGAMYAAKRCNAGLQVV